MNGYFGDNVELFPKKKIIFFFLGEAVADASDLLNGDPREEEDE